MQPEAFGPYSDNISNYYRHMREHDTFAAYAVLPPQAARNPEFYHRLNISDPSLRVIRESDDGVVSFRDEDAGDRCGVRERIMDRQPDRSGA